MFLYFFPSFQNSDLKCFQWALRCCLTWVKLPHFKIVCCVFIRQTVIDLSANTVFISKCECQHWNLPFFPLLRWDWTENFCKRSQNKDSGWQEIFHPSQCSGSCKASWFLSRQGLWQWLAQLVDNSSCLQHKWDLALPFGRAQLRHQLFSSGAEER